MYSPKEVQKATNAIISALEKRQLKEHSIHQYAQHYQELNSGLSVSDALQECVPLKE